MTTKNPPFEIIQITCCMNCMYYLIECGTQWCALMDDVTIPDGYCIGYESGKNMKEPRGE